MVDRDWKIFVFEHRGLLADILAGFSYLLSLLIPLRIYTVESFLAGIGLLIVGVSLRMLAIGFGSPGTSGRGRRLKADRLNISGPYAFTRNPIYLGNICSAGGLGLMLGNISFLCFLVPSLLFMYWLAVLAEETFLEERFGGGYETYKMSVPRFLPLPRRNPYTALPWSRFALRRILRREHDTWYLLLSLATGVSVYRGYLPVVGGIALFIFLSLGWVLLKFEKRLSGRESPQPFSEEFSYLAAFFVGVVAGVFLFVSNPDLFLTVLGRWL
jgi:protein-S-isoprenylcysteine O-methyltransferase Ste14